MEHGTYKGQALSEATGRGERTCQRDIFHAAKQHVVPNLFSKLAKLFPHVNILYVMHVRNDFVYSDR